MDASGIIPITLLLAMLSIFYSNNIIVEGRNFSQQEYSQMKAYLKTMNKPAVMSIKTEGGDVYDCVDIYKQPAFDHPLLINHILQREPTSYPNGTRRNNIDYEIQNIGLKDGGCPKGYVPIRRTQRKDFLNAAHSLQFGKKLTSDESKYFAVLKTPTREYYGTRAIVNIWNPRVGNVHSFSTSQLWIIAGPESELNAIEVGLVLDPKLYGDGKTRLFTYWTTDGFRKTGCINIKCPGFVQVNGKIPIDGSFDRVSTTQGKQYEVKFDVFKDPKSGNWYLLKDDITIGYWPSTLFNHLSTKAESVHWGGQVSQCAGCPFPQMGSGRFPDGGYGVAAYMKGLQVIDNTNMVLKDPKGSLIDEDRKSCYRAQDKLFTTGHFSYGGPGGSC